MDYGFRVVISSRFADIFRGNAGKAGLLAAEVAHDDVELLWKLIEQNPGLEITVNLQDRIITAGTVVLPFNIDDYTAWRLLEGLDDIGLTLRKLRCNRSFRGSGGRHVEAAHSAGVTKRLREPKSPPLNPVLRTPGRRLGASGLPRKFASFT